MNLLRSMMSCTLVALLAVPVFAHQSHSKPHARVTDEQIMGIIMAVDNSEIAAANVVKTKKVTHDIAHYAHYLKKQHMHNLALLKKLEHKTGLVPAKSQQSIMIAKDAKAEGAKLTALNGKAFESAYIDAMVTGHAGGLKLIDTVLLKDASNVKVKTFVDNFRKMVAHHLSKGKKIQKTM